MSMIVADYAFSHPTMAQLKAAGVEAVGRYFGQDEKNDGKNLTSPEAVQLAAAGIKIVSLFEYGAEQAKSGGNQGAVDVALAIKQASAVRMPPGRPVYFAVDWDIPDYAPGLPNTTQNAHAKLGPVAAYFAAIRTRLGGNTGAYGGYWAIKRLFDAGLINWGMQTAAWSGGQWDTRAQLRQTGATELGATLDVDVPERADFGQWLPGVANLAPPPPAPLLGLLIRNPGAATPVLQHVTSTDGAKTWR